MDPKRPYGFSGDGFTDIAEILDPVGVAEAAARDELDVYEATHHEAYLRVHRETETVLRILLRNASAPPGVYEYTNRNEPWVYLGPAPSEERDA